MLSSAKLCLDNPHQYSGTHIDKIVIDPGPQAARVPLAGNLPDVSADFARPLARHFRPGVRSLESGITARNPIQHPGENV